PGVGLTTAASLVKSSRVGGRFFVPRGVWAASCTWCASATRPAARKHAVTILNLVGNMAIKSPFQKGNEQCGNTGPLEQLLDRLAVIQQVHRPARAVRQGSRLQIDAPHVIKGRQHVL